MEKCVLSFPRLASGKSLIALIVTMLLSASVIAQPVFIKNISSRSHSFTNVNGKIYYASSDSLFTASASGVTFVKKLNENISSISGVTMGDKFYIITATSTAGQQGLWVSTGTAASTIKVGAYSSIVPRIVHQTSLYLSVNDGVHGYEIWKLSATNAFTMVKDINAGAPNGFTQYVAITISNNQLFFIANDGAGDDIWRTDGTSSGTTKAVDVPFASIEDLTDVNGTMFFEHDSLATYTFDAYTELWKTQGTAATTQLVEDFGYNYNYNGLAGFIPFKGKLYFHHILEAQTDLMVSDGTEAGTQVVTEAASGIESFMQDMITFNNYLVWYSETQGFANPIMKTDGTTAGTSLVHGLNNVVSPPDYDFSYVDLTPAGDRLYFVDHAMGVYPADGEGYFLYESTPEYVQATSQSMVTRYNFPYNNTKNLTAVTGNDVMFTTWDINSDFYRLWFYNPDAPAGGCEGSGTVLQEIWVNAIGTDVRTFDFSTQPTGTARSFGSFETSQFYANNYASRMRAWICVPQSGEYTFWISSDDQSELYLSTDESEANKQLIAWVYGYTPFRKYDKYPSQKSVQINLEAGRKYYIEARHKEGNGNDFISVGWQLPGGAMERPIGGSRLIPYTPPSCEGTGTIVREIWTNIPGTSVSGIPVNSAPNRTVELTSFATPNYYANDYGSRIRGYLCAPATGAYTFWIASDDNSELWLSTNDDPATKRKIASVTGATSVNQWTKYGSQVSGSINLVQGQRYYIEALHKEANGGDHVEVGWQLPNGVLERPIAGSRLSPFEPSATMTAQAVDETEMITPDEGSLIKVAPNPVTTGKVTVTAQGTEFSRGSVMELQLVEMTGEVVYTTRFQCNDNCGAVELDFSDQLRPGLYLLKGTDGQQSFSRRLIVK
jgi:ELWxxDGT repeat protein